MYFGALLLLVLLVRRSRQVEQEKRFAGEEIHAARV
jgi:hypothetical protein